VRLGYVRRGSASGRVGGSDPARTPTEARAADAVKLPRQEAAADAPVRPATRGGRAVQGKTGAWLASSPWTGGERDVRSARPRPVRGVCSSWAWPQQSPAPSARSLRWYSDRCPWISDMAKRCNAGKPRGVRTVVPRGFGVNDNLPSSNLYLLEQDLAGHL
jgi:hypothetical protein